MRAAVAVAHEGMRVEKHPLYEEIKQEIENRCPRLDPLFKGGNVSKRFLKSHNWVFKNYDLLSPQAQEALGFKVRSTPPQELWLHELKSRLPSSWNQASGKK